MEETQADGTEMANVAESQAVPAVTKSPKKSQGHSIFSWIIVLALLGAWMSVAVVWFELVEYNNVVGTLGKFYDADGDGDFDAEDAKVLLEHSTRKIGHKLKAALKEQLRIIHEKIEAKKIAKMALAEVRSILSREEEERKADLAAKKMKEETEAKLLKEKKRKEREVRLAKEKAERERAERERLAKEKAEKERLAKEQAEKERLRKEQAEKDRLAQERADKLAKEKAEKEKAEKLTKEKAEKETAEKLAKEKAEKERAEKLAKEKAEKERAEKLAKEKAEKERAEKERLAKEKAEKEKAEKKDASSNHKAEEEPLEESDKEIKTKLEKEDNSVHLESFMQGSTPEDTPENKSPAMTHEPKPTVAPEVTPEVPETSKPQSTSESAPKPTPGTAPETEEDKTNLLNKSDKKIKSEINAAEKLRKKGKVEEALQAFEALAQKYPQSPRSRYGKAQAEDDMAEKLRSNEMLLKAVNTYREAAELSDAPADLIKAALKRSADRQQFLGRTKGSLATLERLVRIFPEDISLKNDLGVAHLLIGDNKGAKQIYEEVLDMASDDGFAKVHYGFILKSENKIAESIPYLKEGLESKAPGTDDGRFYFHLGDALQRVGDQKQAYEWYETGYRHGHFASVWQRSLYNVAGLRAQPWWTAKETGYTDLVRTLERNWLTIRDEALTVMDSSSGLFLPEDENLRETGDWGQFTLWQQGRKAGSSCQNVPKTCALLERFKEATTCKRGQIKFSVMQPGTHVWPHTGPTNCRLRMHLGLVIPAKGCRIRCTDQTREWEEGKVLIFDDSFEHEVWQDADSYRLIFIVDVWHPELSQSQRHALSPI
ncbi:aspartyl/asparaginyl beta-hydroxylase [Silurus meridionalis]|uniref:aspartyl/asparaginyl beta-hydroxylase n=1 Tax=Silurus meridionalis TaxID=175797 RepID=UPI001EEBCE68|nr:aspartyl/asparaginyl beta-hydroxylase [Silurus meridionalis]